MLAGLVVLLLLTRPEKAPEPGIDLLCAIASILVVLRWFCPVASDQSEGLRMVRCLTRAQSGERESIANRPKGHKSVA